MDFAESIVNSIPGGSGTDPSPVIVSGLGG